MNLDAIQLEVVDATIPTDPVVVVTVAVQVFLKADIAGVFSVKFLYKKKKLQDFIIVGQFRVIIENNCIAL